MHKLVSVFIFIFFEILANFENYGGKGMRLRPETHNNISGLSLEYCNLEQLEYRMRAIDTQIVEKSDHIRSEIRHNYNRIRNLERQSASVRSILEDLKRGTDQQKDLNSEMSKTLEIQIGNLAKGMQIVLGTLRVMNTNIGDIRRNMSAAVQTTQALTSTPERFSKITNTHNHLSQNVPENCQDLLRRSTNISGVYLIRPHSSPRAFMALCDMETRGGGWTYVHNRYTGEQDFYLNWSSYKIGFGNLGGEFWLGLEHLHHLTGYEVNELLVDLVDLDGNRVYAHYSAFSVGSEEEGYPIKVLVGYSGTAGDSLSYHAGSKFSTKDKDQDEWKEGHCAQAHTGAWWYKSCEKSNLNGEYIRGDFLDKHMFRGMYWNDFHGAQYSLLRARMMVRPRDFSNLFFFSDSKEDDIYPN